MTAPITAPMKDATNVIVIPIYWPYSFTNTKELIITSIAGGMKITKRYILFSERFSSQKLSHP